MWAYLLWSPVILILCLQKRDCDPKRVSRLIFGAGNLPHLGQIYHPQIDQIDHDLPGTVDHLVPQLPL